VDSSVVPSDAAEVFEAIGLIARRHRRPRNQPIVEILRRSVASRREPHGAHEVVMPVSEKPAGSNKARRVPQQVTHWALVFLLAAVAFVIVRSLLVPPTFGEFGHYRGAAVAENAAKPIKFAARRPAFSATTTRPASNTRGRT